MAAKVGAGGRVKMKTALRVAIGSDLLEPAPDDGAVTRSERIPGT
jgi:hypothetical protein